MKKKFSKEALLTEWESYKKWYEKQAKKDMALSGRSFVLTQSFQEYMNFRDQVVSRNAAEGIFYHKSGDVLAEMKRLSFEASNKQIQHLAGEIQKFLDEASEEKITDFILRFGEGLIFDKNGRIDGEAIALESLRGHIAPLAMKTGKNHGWYGGLADMMEYINSLGFTVSWNS